MVTWSEFAGQRPDLVGAARRMVYTHGLGLAHIATVRRDGGPRVHPFCPILFDEGMYAFIVPGPKLQDLRRDPRYALTTDTGIPPRTEDEFFMTGTVRMLDDRVLFERLRAQMLAERSMEHPWPGFDDQQLIALDVERVMVVQTLEEHGLPAGHTIWRA